ncbi:hypothetical protein [Xanthomonas sp. XNM01]|uniref:hypothetical protein n=1 Tax=Xanthomonas sp. XNM01 TaxID=2769289 RepID=UPI00178357AC|nr:hypothetical protein [Xanthomonas sp. XNM01]MBD9368866.1 hypothetical protein [Xanthomonas sp. XNM01]
MSHSAAFDDVIERVVDRLTEIEQVSGRDAREQQAAIFAACLRAEAVHAADAVESAFRDAYAERFGD